MAVPAQRVMVMVMVMVMAGWCLAAALGLTGCAASPEARESARDGVFVHIQSGPDKPHHALMALRMAEIMAPTQDVLVYFDVDAVRLVLADAPPIAMEPFGSSSTMLDGLIERGVTLYACPGCLEAAGKSPTDLRQGVQVADKAGFFAFTQGRILTLDY